MDEKFKSKPLDFLEAMRNKEVKIEWKDENRKPLICKLISFDVNKNFIIEINKNIVYLEGNEVKFIREEK